MRSAGFPFELLDSLSVLESSPLLQRYEELLDSIHTAEEMLKGIVAANAPTALAKLERKFKERAPLGSGDMPQSVREAGGPWFARRLADLQEAQTLCEQLLPTFSMELGDNRRRLLACLSSPEAREALFLSNPESLQRVDALTASLANDQASLDRRSRQRLRLGWNYLQRLCAKNDTSSFFGPITWGRFRPDCDVPLQVQCPPGPWLASRQTFFEHWVILRLSRAIIEDPLLHPAIPLTLTPGCHVRNKQLHFPLDKQWPLHGPALAVLQALQTDCGQSIPRSQKQLHHTLTAEGISREEYLPLLGFLLDKGVLEAQLAVPPGHPQAMAQLRAQVHALDAPATAKAPWLQVIDQLEAQRQVFARGDLETRCKALEAMSRTLAGARVDLYRAQGKMYVGRFPVYEDCGRNLHVTLGDPLASDIQHAMQIVMELNHWLAGAVAVRLHDHYLQHWQALASRDESRAVDFLKFYNAVQGHQDCQGVTGEIRAILQAAWEKLAQETLTASPDELRLSEEDLGALLAILQQQEPRANCFPGFTLGVHSPDFMLAARDEAAVAAGDYAWVIGEIHPAVHTVSQPVAQPFCPDPAAIRTEVTDLLAPATAVLADSSETYQRSHIDWLDVESLYQVVLPGSVGRVDSERCLPAGRGKVILDQGILYYQDSFTGFTQDLLTVIPSELHRACFALARNLLGYGISARVVCSRLILKRRSWNIRPQDLPGPGLPAEDLHSYLQWRQWGRLRDMPRYVFVKITGEPKPIFVDFGNPLSLDLLANLCKTPQDMLFSEMRPTPDELWLKDGRGRYCSEFRTSFVSLNPTVAQVQIPHV
ncbi:lantibiotic dehydratase [Azotobacter armeniacus]